MSDQLDSNWYTSGLITTGGLAHLISLHRSLLVMDVYAWARAQSKAYLRDAKTATTASARVMMETIGRDLRQWADGDRAFLESGTQLWQCSLTVAIRAKIGLLKVTPENFEEYISQVMGHTVPAQRNVPPTFLFVADRHHKELYVTQDSAYIAEFAMDGVFRSVVSKRDLMFLFREVTNDYQLAHEKRARFEAEEKNTPTD